MVSAPRGVEIGYTAPVVQCLTNGLLKSPGGRRHMGIDATLLDLIGGIYDCATQHSGPGGKLDGCRPKRRPGISRDGNVEAGFASRYVSGIDADGEPPLRKACRQSRQSGHIRNLRRSLRRRGRRIKTQRRNRRRLRPLLPSASRARLHAAALPGRAYGTQRRDGSVSVIRRPVRCRKAGDGAKDRRHCSYQVEATRCGT
jgi:hypothetical protein